MNEKVSLIVKKAAKILREKGMGMFFKKTLFYIIRHCFIFPFALLIFPFALLKIKYLNKKNLNLNDLINISFCKFYGLIRPLQIQDEILELLKILDEIKPKVIIEIGTANGGTLFLFSRIASEDAIIISIDLPGGKFGGGYPNWKIPLYKAFSLSKQKLSLIRVDSHDQETLKKVKKILNNRKADFLFIDGDHTYEGVKRDFEMYSPLVKEGGIIAFHDIVAHSIETECEVDKFWKGIKDYTSKEIVKNCDQGWAGIGMLRRAK